MISCCSGLGTRKRPWYECSRHSLLPLHLLLVPSLHNLMLLLNFLSSFTSLYSYDYYYVFILVLLYLISSLFVRSLLIQIISLHLVSFYSFLVFLLFPFFFASSSLLFSSFSSSFPFSTLFCSLLYITIKLTTHGGR